MDCQYTAIKWVEFLTIVFGLFCVGLSIILSYRFKRVHSTLARALSHQLFAEAFIGFVTVIFAITSWLDLYKTLPPELVVVMRMLIFGVGAMTSVNLYKKVKAIENSAKDDDKQKRG